MISEGVLPIDRPADEPHALLVEREGQARKLITHFLEEMGLRVELACDGASAWEKTRELLPDLVLTEILLPKRDGLSLCRQIKTTRETHHIRVVVISILAAATRAQDASADAFLLKPLSQEKLASEIARLLPWEEELREEPA